MKSHPENRCMSRTEGMVNGALLPVDGGFLCYGGVV